MTPGLPWFKTREEDGKTLVFDPLRRKYVKLTPEEEVRQKALYLLVEHLKVPSGLIAVEYSVKVNGPLIIGSQHSPYSFPLPQGHKSLDIFHPYQL